MTVSGLIGKALRRDELHRRKYQESLVEVGMGATVMRLGQHFKAMARNNAWSDARLHLAYAALREVEFTAARTSFLPSLQHTLNHILVVNRAYLADLVGTAGRY